MYLWMSSILVPSSFNFFSYILSGFVAKAFKFQKKKILAFWVNSLFTHYTRYWIFLQFFVLSLNKNKNPVGVLQFQFARSVLQCQVRVVLVFSMLFTPMGVLGFAKDNIFFIRSGFWLLLCGIWELGFVQEVVCDGGCGIPFGSERDLLKEKGRVMEGNFVMAFLSLFLIFLLSPLCLILANMEGLF